MCAKNKPLPSVYAPFLHELCWNVVGGFIISKEKPKMVNEGYHL